MIDGRVVLSFGGVVLCFAWIGVLVDGPRGMVYCAVMAGTAFTLIRTFFR